MSSPDIRRFINIVEDQSSLLDNVDLTSLETFLASLRRIPKEQLTRLNNMLNDKRAELASTVDGLTELYHGAPHEIIAKIRQDGFRITKGRRGGFLGSIDIVDNLGIFLTDSKRLANFFGANRASSSANYEVIPVYVDVSGVLDSNRAPVSIRRVGLKLLQDWYGKSYQSITHADWWWLLDRAPFVDAIKALGYTGVRFREDITVRREAKDLKGSTYFIFDPSMIKLKPGMTIADFYESLKAL